VRVHLKQIIVNKEGDASVMGTPTDPLLGA
jgi:hypothetical protein